MARTGLADLYEIMGDQTVGMRQRINAAISAARVERLSMAGEEQPEAIDFLHWVIDAEFDKGERFSPQFRRECAAAISFWERRCRKAELTFNVSDVDEKREKWRKLINGGICHHLHLRKRWPRDKRILLGPNDPFEVPGTDPDPVLSAVFAGAPNRHERRRLRAIDERITGTWSGTEAERQELLRVLATAIGRTRYPPTG